MDLPNRKPQLCKRLRDSYYDKYYDRDIYGAEDLNDLRRMDLHAQIRLRLATLPHCDLAIMPIGRRIVTELALDSALRLDVG